MRSPSLPQRPAHARCHRSLPVCSPFVACVALLSVLSAAHALPPPHPETARLEDEPSGFGSAPTSTAADSDSTIPEPVPQRDQRPLTGAPREDEQPGAVSPEPATWVGRLGALLTSTASAEPGEVGLYVRHVATGAEFSQLADESWYLASGIKVPVAVAVLRRAERGALGLDTELALEAGDFVDGTGHTNRYPPGALLRVDYLLEQMLVYSDNTASDVLIRQVGLDEVNGIARELAGADFAITTLADVRRKVYGGLHAKAARLAFEDWVALRHTVAADRVARLRRLAGVNEGELVVPGLDDAYDAYYAAGHNSGSLRAYGTLLARVAEGKALGPEGTTRLLAMLSRIRTGQRRLRAVLPEHVRFAHKTGTQHRRVCDLGVTLAGSGAAEPRVVIAACARGFGSMSAAERALRAAGSALNDSGIWEISPPAPPQELRRDDEPTNLAAATPPALGERTADGRAGHGDPRRWPTGMDVQTSAP